MSYPRRTREHLELFEIRGDPTEEERAAIALALQRTADGEKGTVSTSLWPLAATARPGSVGVVDYREDVTNEDAWRLSTRSGGREPERRPSWR